MVNVLCLGNILINSVTAVVFFFIKTFLITLCLTSLKFVKLLRPAKKNKIRKECQLYYVKRNYIKEVTKL